MSQHSVIKLQNITKVFNVNTVNENRVLKGINLDINQNDFITVIGGNGAGKSTLLNLIAGTLSPSEGKIMLVGKDATKVSEENRAKFISRVFQDPSMGTAPRMTIRENLALAELRGEGRGLRIRQGKKYDKKYKQALSQVGLGLEERLDAEVLNLSGGQRQTIATIMATIKKPELLLLDEHTAALDPKAANLVMELTDRQIKENNLTAMMITHNMQHAIDYGNRLIMMVKGEIVVDIKGEEKKQLTVDKLLDLFRESSSSEELSDRMLLQ